MEAHRQAQQDCATPVGVSGLARLREQLGDECI